MAVFKKLLFLSFVLLCTVAGIIKSIGAWSQDSKGTWQSDVSSSLSSGFAGIFGSGSGQKHGEVYKCMTGGGSNCWEPCAAYAYCCADPAYLFCKNVPQSIPYEVQTGLGCTNSSIDLAYLAMSGALFNVPSICSAIIPSSISRPLNHGFVSTKKLDFATTAPGGDPNCYNYCGAGDGYSINSSPSITPGSCSPTGCAASSLVQAYGQYYTAPTNNCIPELGYQNCPNNYCNKASNPCPKGTKFESNTPSCYDATLCADYCTDSNSPMCVCNTQSNPAALTSAACQAILPKTASGILSDYDCIKPSDYSPSSIDTASLKFRACVLTSLYAGTVGSMTTPYVVTPDSREASATSPNIVPPADMGSKYGGTYNAIW